MYAVGSSIVRGVRFCVRFFSDDIPDAVKMIENGELQAALGLTKPDAVFSDTRTRVAVHAYFTKKYGKPVSSADFPKLKTAEDVARWYSGALRPRETNDHGERLIRHEKGLGSYTDEDGEFDVTLQGIHLPSNLRLDPRTFEAPKEVRFRRKSPRAKRVGRFRDREEIMQKTTDGSKDSGSIRVEV